MKQILLLEDSDVIEATDWCRPLEFVSMSGGMSDYYSFENAYSGAPENNAKWVTADQVCPSFIGETYGAYRRAMKEVGLAYEFVRGALPKAHTMLSKKQERAAQELRDAKQDQRPLGFGQYQHQSPMELLNSPEGRKYLKWMADTMDKLSPSMLARVAELR